jgi:hypothetical protein
MQPSGLERHPRELNHLDESGDNGRSPNSAEVGWKAVHGYFWIYYNTGNGHKSTDRTEKHETAGTSPWIIKQFKDKEASFSKDPDAGDWHDIFAQEVKNNSIVSFRTVYVDRHRRPLPIYKLPPWNNRRDPSRYVRAYLWVEGTILYK